METFTFYLDRKVTAWYRETHEIEAESLEDAKKQMIESFNEGYTDETFIQQELIHDTIENMEVEDNDGWPTAELFDDEDGHIADNGKTSLTHK